MPNYPPCTRCGHTIHQHSSGECDIKGCACEGWCGSAVDIDAFSVLDTAGTILALTLLAVAFLAGLALGLWL